MNLVWYITNYCNLNCLNCFAQCNNSSDIKFFISEEEVIEILNIIKNKNIKFNAIDLIGGEPFTHQKIFNICNLIHSYFPNILIRIHTNILLLKNFTDKQFQQLQKNYISLNISFYPKKKYLEDYKQILNKLDYFKIQYSYQDNHFLFFDIKVQNINFNNLNKDFILNCIKDNRETTFFLRNKILYPCCFAVSQIPIKNSFYDDSCIFFKNNSTKKIKEILPICKKCQHAIQDIHPWHLENEFTFKELKNIKNNNHFNLYKNDYQNYYKLYFSQDEEIKEIIQHPLFNTNLNNTFGLYENHYINNKYKNGYLDILIYYTNIKNITKFIIYLKNQNILNKCNLYFIKNINASFLDSDEILYNEFYPFKSLNYNSYFLKAESYEEAKKLFMQHSFLFKKIILDPNNLKILQNFKYLEEEYFK